MADWRDIHLPDAHWAPRGLPGALKSLPGAVARVASESRFAGEIAQFEMNVLCPAPAKTWIDRQVLVVPGFGFGDISTIPLQVALRKAGFRVVRSQIVANIRCSDRAVDRLAQVAADAVADDHGQRLMVVGHSRGGTLARGLAAEHPELVSTVVALASPLNDEFAFYEIPKPMVEVLRAVHYRDPELKDRQCATRNCTCPYMLASHRPFPDDVDLISYFTTSDGIVDWRSCVVPGAENVEVPGTHLGMGMRPDTLNAVVERLIVAARKF